MILKSLTLNNFRQFKGQTTICFSVDAAKNVTVILGNNTFGKTTILQAFNWCFYGRTNFDGDNKDMLLNYDLAHEMVNGGTQMVTVTIELTHAGCDYTLIRSQEYVKECNEVSGGVSTLDLSYKQSDGQTKVVQNGKEGIINDILPEGLSDYFFFDTERVSSIGNRSDLGSAVKGLLGLTILDNLRSHLGTKAYKTSVIGEFYADMNSNGNVEAQKILENIETEKDRLDGYVSETDFVQQQLASYKAREDSLNEKLRAEATTAELQRQRDEIGEWLESARQRLGKNTNAFIDYIGNGSAKKYGLFDFFIQPLAVEAMDFLKQAKISDKGIKDLQSSTIMELLERGRCLCGCELKAGTPLYESVVNELKFVPPESIGNTVRNFVDNLEQYMDRLSVYNEIERLHDDIVETQGVCDDLSKKIEDIDFGLKDKENMRIYTEQLEDVRNKKESAEERLNGLNMRKGACQQKIEAYQKMYDKLTSTLAVNQKLKKYIACAETIQNYITTLYSSYEGDVRQSLIHEVNDVFGRMYSGSRRVDIDEKYNVVLYSKVGNEEKATGESEGLRRVKNFAFIASLVSLAKNKMLKKNKAGEDVETLVSEPYPLVLDAPFSNADEEHVASISRELPKAAEQIIMFVMQKDWKWAFPVIGDRVGRQYALDKKSEQLTLIEEIKNV